MLGHQLAYLLYQTEEHERAEALFVEVIAARRKVLGDKNPATLISLNTFG